MNRALSNAIVQSFSRRGPVVKYFDTAIQDTLSTNASWTATEIVCASYIEANGTTVSAYTDSSLNPSAQGVGYGQVTNQRYFIEKIRIKGHIEPDVTTAAASTSGAGVVRIALVIDQNCAGVQAQGENVFTDWGDSTLVNHSFQQTGQITARRYRVVKDFTFIMNITSAVNNASASTVSYGRREIPFSFMYKPKQPIEVNLLAGVTTPATSSLQDVNMFLLGHSNVGCDIIAVSRCYFTDD